MSHVTKGSASVRIGDKVTVLQEPETASLQDLLPPSLAPSAHSAETAAAGSVERDPASDSDLAKVDARIPSSINATPELSVPIPEADNWTAFDGPFYYRRPRGFWIQVGPSLVTQQISNSNVMTGAGSTQQLAFRNGLGYWHDRYFAEGYWREPVMGIQGESYHPRWVQGLVGVGFELPRFWIVTPHLSLIGGWEMFSNEGNRSAKLISSYAAPTVGFRSRFILGKRWETGGDLQYTVGDGI